MATATMRETMRTPVDKRRPLPRGDVSDVIEKRKAELARLKRENNNMYSLVQQRVLSKNSTPGVTPVLRSRTPRTEEKMRSVLEHFPSFPRSDERKSPKERSPGGAKEKLNMDVNDENVNDNTTTAMSPWRRHLQLLHEAKVAKTLAQEGEAKAVAALAAVEQRLLAAREESQSKSGEIASLTDKIAGLTVQFDTVLKDISLRMGQSDTAAGGDVQAKLDANTAKLLELERSVRAQQQASDLKLSQLKGELAVDSSRGYGAPSPPSALTRFCVSTLFWAALFMLVYAYVYRGNCECVNANFWRITN